MNIDTIDYLLEKIGKLELELHYLQESMVGDVLNIPYRVSSDNAISPTKNYFDDAGTDLYSTEDVNLEFCVPTVIDTYIQIEFPQFYHGLIWDRSSMGKKGIIITGGLIDNPYRGDISVTLINLNKNVPNYQIKKGDKITQLVFVKLPKTYLIYKDELDKTDRGANGFGSSGR